MAEVRLVYGTATDVGNVRKVNEDSLFASPPLFMVADGMGGHHGGDVASGIVAEEFGRVDAIGLDSPVGARLILETLEVCQRRIGEYATEQQGAHGTPWYAGTTVVAALLVHDDGPSWVVANLGDSRAYRYAAGGLEQVSVDHSLVQELISAGRITPEQAATHPERHVITRALGGPDAPDPDLFRLRAKPGVRLMLCSDGISGMVDDAAIATVLSEESGAQRAADRLVADALAAGGLDNATAVVIDVVAEAAVDSSA